MRRHCSRTAARVSSVCFWAAAVPSVSPLKEGGPDSRFFDLRTLYNFRRRLSQYNVEQGTNLLAAAFVDITNRQITALKVRTGLQRMDSTQLAFDIVLMCRLQLTVETIQRLPICASCG